MRVAIVWGSSSGQTEEVARRLHERLGAFVERCVDVADIGADAILAFDVVLIGVSTWDVGQTQYDWADRIAEMEDADWSGTRVAFFGTGDSLTYDDTFVDAFRRVWERIEGRGAELIGSFPAAGYRFVDSASLTADRSHFLGLPLDEENEAHLTDARLAAWTEQLEAEIAALR